jgi:hypothetical protein
MSAYRYLRSIDANAYRDHLLRLDADSRYGRFSNVLSDKSVKQYVDEIDWTWCKIIGFFGNGALRGAAEIRYERALFPASADLAFSVETEFQNTRVGTNLMARSLLNLRNRGVNTAHVVCLLTNTWMQKLALRYRADTMARNGDVFLTIEVPYGTAGTLLAEMADGYIGWMDASLRMAMQFPGPAPRLTVGRERHVDGAPPVTSP